MSLRDESGFTLTELLVAIIVGMIVTLAAFALLDRAVVETGKTTDRVDSTQRGRVAMDLISRHLRSQVCPSTGGSAIQYGDSTSVVFWAFFGTKNFAPQRYTIAWNPNNQSITETVDDGAGTPAVRNSTVITSARLLNNPPLFSYYAYPTTGTPEPTVQLAPPPAVLSAAERARVARIDINFTAAPTRAVAANTPSESTRFTDQVYARTSNPNGLDGPQGPTC